MGWGYSTPSFPGPIELADRRFGIIQFLGVNIVLVWISITFVIAAAYCFVAVRLVQSRLDRSGIRAFIIIATGIASIRIASLWTFDLRARSALPPTLNTFLNHTLLPEGVVMYQLNLHNVFWHMIVFTILLVLGTFFWSLPLLLIRAKRRIR